MSVHTTRRGFNTLFAAWSEQAPNITSRPTVIFRIIMIVNLCRKDTKKSQSATKVPWDLILFYYFASCSTVFLVALHGPNAHEGGNTEEGEELVPYTLDCTTADKYGANGLDEVVHGIDVGGEIGQLGHGARGCKEAAE